MGEKNVSVGLSSKSNNKTPENTTASQAVNTKTKNVLANNTGLPRVKFDPKITINMDNHTHSVKKKNLLKSVTA